MWILCRTKSGVPRGFQARAVVEYATTNTTVVEARGLLVKALFLVSRPASGTTVLRFSRGILWPHAGLRIRGVCRKDGGGAGPALPRRRAGEIQKGQTLVAPELRCEIRSFKVSRAEPSDSIWPNGRRAYWATLATSIRKYCVADESACCACVYTALRSSALNG